MSRDEALMKLFAEDNKPFALEDVKVVEIAGENFAAAIAGSLLAEFGAKVVRIEFDDQAKNISLFGAKVEGCGIPYLVESRNKEIVKFSESAKELINSCDILIDGMKPGYLDSLGIGYRQISEKNPGLIYVAVSPYGHFTNKAREFANVPDSDLTAQAYNGYPSIIGNPYLTGKYSYPLRAGIWAAWTMAGLNAACGAMIALIERKKSGKGQFVDVATHDALAVIHTFPTIVGFLFGKSRTRYGTLDYIIYPFGYYRVKDGYVALATPTDPDFRALLKIIDRWDLEPDYRYSLDRISDDPERLKVLDEELNKTLQKYTVKQLVSRARKKTKGKILGRLLGAPIIVKLNKLQELLNDPHWRLRNSLIKFNPDGKGILIPNTAVKMSETPPRIFKILGKEVKKS
ncbi:MAG: hypothetical protein PWQ58_315 [Archaeoglobaceae archaeon]|nr:hypothetical protein [Archaeoglobaceae archaeon]